MTFFKLCIVINPNDFLSWHRKLLLKVLNDNDLRVSIIVLEPNVNPTNDNFISKCRDNIFSLYKKIDKKIFKINSSQEKKDNYKDLFKNIKVFKSNLKNLSNFFTNDGNLNNTSAVLNLTQFKLSNRIFENLKYGIWEYRIGYRLNSDLKLNGMVEVLYNLDLTSAYLVARMSTSNKKKIIYESYSSTDKRSISRNLNPIYIKASSFVSRVIKLLKEDENYISNSRSIEEGEISKNLSLLTFLFLISRHYFRYLQDKIIDRFYINQWSLLYYDNNDKLLNRIKDYKKIIPPTDRFYADPFIIEKRDIKYIFFEEAMFKNMKGFISVIKINTKGIVSKPVPVLEEDYHLSYPFIFEDNNDYYLIPESATNNTISIYKCTSFPYKWEFKSNIIEGIKAYDATIFKYNNKFWLFANVVEERGASSWDELHIYYNDDLLSKNWLPHKKNPVVCDVRSARPAGKIFLYKGKYIRPAQDCSKRYGYGLTFNEILILNESEYGEKIIKSIKPTWNKNILGVHTVNSTNNFTVTDVISKSRR